MKNNKFLKIVLILLMSAEMVTSVRAEDCSLLRSVRENNEKVNKLLDQQINLSRKKDGSFALSATGGFLTTMFGLMSYYSYGSYKIPQRNLYGLGSASADLVVSRIALALSSASFMFFLYKAYEYNQLSSLDVTERKAELDSMSKKLSAYWVLSDEKLCRIINDFKDVRDQFEDYNEFLLKANSDLSVLK